MSSRDASTSASASPQLRVNDDKEFGLIPLNQFNGVLPTIMVYDPPTLPSTPPVGCKSGSVVMSCLGDRLETDRSSISMASDADTIVEPLDLTGISDDDLSDDGDRLPTGLAITMEMDAANPCHLVGRVASAASSVAAESDTGTIVEPLDLGSLASSRSSVAAESDTGTIVEPLDLGSLARSRSASPIPLPPVSSEESCFNSSFDEELAMACNSRCADLFDAYVERQRLRQRQMEVSQANMLEAVRQRMAAAEKVLLDNVELRKKMRNEERWSEGKRQQRRLEGPPGWLRRLRLTLRTLTTRRSSNKISPKGREPSGGTGEEKEVEASIAMGDPEVDQLGRVAQDATRSQVNLERMREVDSLSKARHAAATDGRLMSERLAEVQKTYSAYIEQIDRIVTEDALDFSNCVEEMKAAINLFRNSELGLNDNTGVEEMLEILRPGSGFRENLLLPPANWEFGPDNTTKGPLDDEEEKRRRKEILRRKKPKKMGFKRRFLLCLRCLT